MRPAKIEFFIQLNCPLEFGFHFAHEFESTNRFGTGELAKVHREIIVPWAGGVLARQSCAAGVDPFFCQTSALRISFCEVGQIEAGAAELPGRLDAVSRFLKTAPRLLVDAFEASYRFIFSFRWPLGQQGG